MTPEQSADMIYNLLNEALSEQAERRNLAEKALREAEEQQDFFASLVQIATADDTDAPPLIRWLAAVQAKNATPRSWRRRTKINKVTDDERQFVTNSLIQSLGNERHSNIATQVSVWISHISKLDFPNYSHSTVSQLAEALTPYQPKSLHSLITLDMTLKQLCSKRLLPDKRALQRIGPDTFTIIYNVFVAAVDQLIDLFKNPATLNSNNSNTNNTTNAATTNFNNNHSEHNNINPSNTLKDTFQTCIYCLKSLRRIISNACTHLSQLHQLNHLFVKIESHLDLFFCTQSSSNEIPLRLSLLVAKLVRVTQARHPVTFQPYLTGFLKIYYNILISYEFDRSDDRTLTHIATFIKSCYQSVDYGITPSVIQKFSLQQQQHPQQPLPIDNSDPKLLCQQTVLLFFNDQVLNNLIQVMIKKIFVLTPTEVETWSSDPESLVREEDTTVEWGTENLRNECEDLFSAILIQNKEKIAPYIINLTKTISNSEPYLLDSCYRAIGRTAYDINGVFNIETWFQESLNSILQMTLIPTNENIGGRIIQARSIWLIGQFVSQLSRTLRSTIYPLLINLLSNTQNDMVILLTCAKTIRYLVDDLGFYGEDFSPYLSVCIKSCFNLITKSHSFETKRDLLDTVSSLVISSESFVVRPVAQQIVSDIPTLWQQCTSNTSSSPQKDVNNASESTTLDDEEENQNDETYDNENGGYAVTKESNGEELLRSAIVTLLTTVIRKTQNETLKLSSDTRRIIMLVLQFSIDIRPKGGGSHMLEEGCDLWLTIVEACSEYHEDLRIVFPQIIDIFNRDYGNLQRIFEIIKAYMLIGGQPFMSEFNERIIKIVRSTLGRVRDRGILAAVDILDVLIRAYPQEAIRLIASILQSMIETVSAGNESGVVMGAYMLLIARSALLNVSQMESEVFRGNANVYVEIMDLLLEHLDSMNKLPRRQVGTLALIGLGGRYLTSPQVLKRIPGVLNCVVQVLSEEKRIHTKAQSRIDKNDFEHMVSRNGEAEEASEDPYGIFGPTRSANPMSFGEKRIKQLAEKDTEVCMKVSDACIELLRNLSESGQDNYNKILASTDSNVLQQLEELLKK